MHRTFNGNIMQKPVFHFLPTLLVLFFALHGDAYALQGEYGSRSRNTPKKEPSKTSATTTTTTTRRNVRPNAPVRDGVRTAGREGGRPPKPPVQGTLNVLVNPSDSAVFVNGQRFGTMDEQGRLSGGLKPGSYTVRASKPGYVEQTQNIMLEPGGSEAVYMKLQIMPGSINIKPTVPDGEIVIVNKDKDTFIGRYTGNVTALNVEPGLYEVKVTKSGYQTATRDVAVKAGESVYLEPPLESEPDLTARASSSRLNFTPNRATTVEAYREGKNIVVTLSGRSGDMAATLGSLDVTVSADARSINSSNVNGMLTGFPCQVDFVRIENISEYAFTEPPGASNQWSRAIVRIRPKDSKRPIRFSINWKIVERVPGG